MLCEHFCNGINLGGWLSQYEYFAPQPLNEPNLEKHFSSYITREDLVQIKSWGFDHVRLPVSGYLLYNRAAKALTPLAVKHIDTCVKWCGELGLNLVLDLHDLWGNVYGAMDTPMPLLTQADLRDNFYNIWRLLTEHFAGVGEAASSGFVLMFELLNEVSDATGYLWNRMYAEAVRRIRQTDKERPILVGSNCQNSVVYLSQLHLLDDPFVFYNFHYYDPQVFTHQKADFSEELSDFGQTVTYPGDISAFARYLKQHPQYAHKYALVAEETQNDRALMEKLLKNARDFTAYSGHELYCGEFGVINSAPQEEAIKWMSDLLQIFGECHIGHALWNYKSLSFGLLDLDGKPAAGEIINWLRGQNGPNPSAHN